MLLIDKIFGGLQHTITKKTLSQERYSQTFYKSPLPMWFFDTDTYKFLDVNEAATRHYGYTKEEFLNMTIMDIRPAANVRQTEKLVRASKLSGNFYKGVSEHLTKNGDTIYANVESSFLSLDDRRVRLVLATNITAQLEHQVEAFDSNLKLKESELNLRAIFNSVADGFVLLDGSYNVKMVNPKASEAMRFNKDQSPFEVGHSIFDYVENSRLAYFREIIDKVYNGETVDYERLFRSNGIITWIRYTITPVIEEKAVIGTCITGRDITARKLYLHSIEEQNKIFREISWMQSHLVRAPLARIMGLIPMLQNANEEEMKEVISYMLISTGELDDIIKQITKKSARIMEKYKVQLPSE